MNFHNMFTEDDFLLTEILFSPFALEQLEKIGESLHHLREIIRQKDVNKMREFLHKLRNNI